ncbi:MAG: phosphoribosylglycinamide formyltransferase [Bacteroidales bacterium]|nr:phosphoribosylglycinamide formyltransferase [Bacteroidales bacterium]
MSFVMHNLAIFASGSGTNAERIVRYFQDDHRVSIRLIASNRPDAYVLQRAEKLNIPSFIFTREEFYRTDKVLQKMKDEKISWIILAGFLWKVPDNLVQAYSGRMINIHPALLPAYGGKGMYGEYVHKAVLAAGERESGITIHYVNAHYDEGECLFQARCPVYSGDTVETLAARIHTLEYTHFPVVIEGLLSGEES